MAAGKLWSIEETTLALALYLRSPKGKSSVPSTPIADIRALARQLNRTDGSVSLKIANLASLDRRVIESGRKGMANCSENDRRVWNEYVDGNGDIALQQLTDNVDSICRLMELNPESILIANSADIPIGPTTHQVTRLERCYQSMFRSVVLSRYEGQCAVSRLHLDSLLEAAHIIPWAEDESIRLEPYNGLALNPLIHKAYDQHLLGIDGGGIIHVSQKLLTNAGNDSMKSYLESIDNTEIFMPFVGRPSEELLDRHFQHYRQVHS